MRTALLPNAARKQLLGLDAAIQGLYDNGEHELSNQSDALDEAIYIILSFQTDLSRLRLVWKGLRERFPNWETVAGAVMSDVTAPLRPGGLHLQKARTIKRLLREVKEQYGDYSLMALKGLTTEDAERRLLQLPGLSLKAARCVLLYSLHRKVLPIDSNSFRILKRTRVIPRKAVYRRVSLHNALQEAVPHSRRKSLHINLVMHGRAICLPCNPLCKCCPFEAQCPKIGIKVVHLHG